MKQLCRPHRTGTQNLNFDYSPQSSLRDVGASPKYLWIDCVDNHCTPHEIMGISTKDILVYKNLTHQVSYTDLNCLATLQYAIQILNVKHVIVCGHYNCSLLSPLTESTELDLVEQWLRPLYGINQKYQPWLKEYQPESLRLNKICELNIIEQVLQLCKTTVVQNAWKSRQQLVIHGWAYSGENNLLHNIIADISGEQDVLPAYEDAVRSCIGQT